MKSKFSKIISIAMALLLLLTLSKPASATQVTQSSVEETNTKKDFFVPETYSETSIVLRRDRGHCTDVYSWDWCKAHGYASNRPVGQGYIALTAKERECYYNLLKAGGNSLTALVITTPDKILKAVASVCYALYKCFH